ncbi:hypothetical protein LINPERPRIM_LOCUS35232 [Linum perenne]
MFSNEDSVFQFNKRLEEARKFLPISPNLTLADDGGRTEVNVDRQEKPTRKNSHERESSDLVVEGEVGDADGWRCKGGGGGGYWRKEEMEKGERVSDLVF